MSATSKPLSEEEMQRHAAALASQCRAGDCLLLVGDLGAGKTSFARGFIRALCGPQTEVTSPTFTLLQSYTTPKGELWHFDLYRLKSPAELPELGLDEALATGITLIEWPQIAAEHLPQDALTIHILPSGDKRQLVYSEHPAWRARLAATQGTL